MTDYAVIAYNAAAFVLLVEVIAILLLEYRRVIDGSDFDVGGSDG